jgi:hypothetical protein
MLSGPQLGSGRPKQVAFAVPRSMISATRYRQGMLRDSLTITRVTGESTRLLIVKQWRPEGVLAEQLLAPGGMSTPLPAAPKLS